MLLFLQEAPNREEVMSQDPRKEIVSLMHLFE
jgi:hypothetical protein